MLTDKENIAESEQSLKKAKPYSVWDSFKRWIPSIIILPIATYWVFNRGEFGLLDNIDLGNSRGRTLFLYVVWKVYLYSRRNIDADYSSINNCQLLFS